MAVNYSLTILNDTTDPTLPASRRSVLQRFKGQVQKLIGGNHAGPNVTVQVRGATTQASGTLTLSGVSGNVGALINGITILVTAAGGDAASAALVAAAINASTDPLNSGIITATSSGAVVTIAAVQPGLTGNCITLGAIGTGVAASGARLAGGAETLTTYTL